MATSNAPSKRFCYSISLDSAIVVGWPELQQKGLPSSYMPQPTLLRHHFELQIFWATAFGGIKEPCDPYVVFTEPCCPEELATLGMHADAGPGRTTELAVCSRWHHFQLSGTQRPSSRKNTYIMDAHGTMIVPSLSDAPTLKYCGWKKSCTSWDRSNPVNNGINYTYQLVQNFFHQRYVGHFRGGTCSSQTKYLSDDVRGRRSKKNVQSDGFDWWIPFTLSLSTSQKDVNQWWWVNLARSRSRLFFEWFFPQRRHCFTKDISSCRVRFSWWSLTLTSRDTL